MKRFVKTLEPLSGLPNGFTEVEYLESTGTQYIDTGYIPTPTTTYKTVFQLTNITTTAGAWFCVFGSVESNNSTFTELFLPRASGDGNVNQILAGSHNTTYLRKDYTWVKNTIYNFEMTPTNVLINGVNQGTISTDSSFTCSHSIYLFARHEYNDAVRYNVSAKIHSFKILEGNTLVHDFIPVLDPSGRPCMYDMIEGKPHYNAGDDEFSYGKQIIPVEYLESTGTQYINTGFAPGTNAGRYTFDIEAQNTSNVQGHGAIGSRSIDAGRNWVIATIYQEASGNIVSQFGYGSAYQNIISSTSGKWTRLRTYIDSSNYILETTVDSIATTSTLPLQTFTNTANVYLFGINNKGSLFTSFPFIGKIRKAKMYDNGTLVRDYIPVIDENNVGYMFDKVTHTLYENKGAGSFSYGKKVYKSKLRLVEEKSSVSGLPNGFKEVEYLESTGTQYIDTGFIYTEGKTSTFESMMEWTKNNGLANFFYGYRSVNSATVSGDMRAFFIYGVNPVGRLAIRYGVNSDSSTTGIALNQKYKIEFDGTYLKVDGNNYTTLTATYTSSNYKSMWLFNCNCTGYYRDDVSTFVGRIYYWKIFNDGILVRDYIPALDPFGVPCMYDKVEGKAYYNQGTGEFTYGKQIIPVEYLQSTGTQYIDTGFAFTDGFSWEIDFDGLTKGATLFGGRTSSTRTAILYQKSATQGIETTCPIAGMTGDQTPFQLADISTGKHKVKMSVASNKGSVWVDGTQVYNEQTFTGSYISGTTQALFADNFGTSVSEYTSSKVYSLKMWQGSAFVRNYIPVIDENNIGYMFDKVTHALYENKGTGAFSYGENVYKRRLRLVSEPWYTKKYDLLTYLEGTGTQWIDTGYTLGNESDIELAFTIINDYDSNSNYSIFGSRNSADSSNIGVAVSYPQFPLYLDFCDTNYSSHRATKMGTNTLNIKYKAVLNKSKRELSLADTSEVLVTNSTSSASFTTPGSAYLFNQRNGFSSNKFIGKIYYCTILNNGTLVRDFRPAKRKSDNKYGMLDMVTRQFYTNAGTGDFTGE